MGKKEYPYQNLSLEDMEGEEWEDVPGLDGYFIISNFGRIKRMEYELVYRDGRVYTYKSMIIKPTLAKSKNNFVGDHIYFLRTTITLFGSIYMFSIARMVYYCFVGVFDLEDKHIIVVFKDGDNSNVLPANLALISMHDLVKRTIARNRHENILLRPEVRKKAIVEMIKKKAKVISQYDTTGKRIKVFNSIPEAAAATGMSKSSISGVLGGRKVTAGGYLWRYGKTGHIDAAGDMKKRKANYKQGLRKTITQYDMEGNKISTYPSIEEASRQTGIISTAIGRVVGGKARSAGNFFWAKGTGKEKINLKGHHHGMGSGNLLIQKPVNRYSIKGRLINSYPSVSAAAKSVGVTPGCLSGALKGLYKTVAGYKWKYKRPIQVIKKGVPGQKI